MIFPLRPAPGCRSVLLGLLAMAAVLGGCGGEQSSVAPAPAAPDAAPAPAQLVLRGGAIYTMDAARSWAEALAVRDGRLAYVGSDRGVQELVGPGTQVVELGGRMVLPGMQDVHVHPISGGMEAAQCDLNGARDAAEYVTRVKAYAEAHPEEPWILGGGWLMSAFGPGGMPSRKLLDSVVPDRPVALSSTDGHTTWVNSRALEIAGITRETPDPVDGRIDRDPTTGEAIGSLQEGAGSLVLKHVPPATLERRVEGLRHALRMLNGYGITAMQDAGVGEPDLEAYAALDAAGGLSARSVLSLRWDRHAGIEQIATLEQRRAQYTRGRVRATTVKIMQDGVMENYTAVMLQPFLVEGSPRGIPMVDPERLKAAVAALDGRGFQVHFHAIGDGAVRQCLDALEAARAQNGATGLRHHISHLQLIDPQDIPRFRALAVIANYQPLWAFEDDYMTDLTAPFVGPERYQRMYTIGSLLQSGATVAFGSDWSVSSANPFQQIEVAVRRADPEAAEGSVYLPQERISLPEAIAAFTINAAYVNGMERDTGSLEAGKAADLAVLDRNLFELDPREISETKVLLTLLDGKPVHGDPAALD